MLLGYLTFSEHLELTDLESKQKDPDRWLTQPEFDRIKELQRKKWSAPVNQKLIFRNVLIKCPHCGHGDVWNSFVVQTPGEIKIGHCKQENGGCGKDFTIKCEPEVSIKITPHKIQQ